MGDNVEVGKQIRQLMGIGKSHEKAKQERDQKLREELLARFKTKQKTFLEQPKSDLENRETVNRVCFVHRGGETIEKDGLQYNVIESPSEEEIKPFAYPLNAKISKICFQPEYRALFDRTSKEETEQCEKSRNRFNSQLDSIKDRVSVLNAEEDFVQDLIDADISNNMYNKQMSLAENHHNMIRQQRASEKANIENFTCKEVMRETKLAAINQSERVHYYTRVKVGSRKLW
jgi:hypothetical protein